MAEIKSTLDLIMERTKNLTMTADEKNAFQRKEWEGKVKGWVQKYIDGTLHLEDLKVHIESSESQFQELRNILKEEILEHIQPESNNALLLKLLEDALDADTRPIMDLITLFQNNLSATMIERRKAIKKALEQKKISGSSVVPNLDRDSEWQEYLQKFRLDFKNQVSSLTGN
jgi:uncharacterized protein YnzC (UPF0291/DUF896 family)